MRRGDTFVQVVRLIGAVILAASASITAEAAASQSASPERVFATLVLRGSGAPAAPDPAASEDSPTVLRGSPLSTAQPNPMLFSCPPGLYFDPSSGCVQPGSAYEPDYGYWPFDWWAGPTTGWRRGLHNRFAQANRRGPAFHLGQRRLGGFAHGFGHPAGLSRR